MLKLKTWTFCKIKLRGAKKGNSFKGCTSKCCPDFVITKFEHRNCRKTGGDNLYVYDKLFLYSAGVRPVNFLKTV